MHRFFWLFFFFFVRSPCEQIIAVTTFVQNVGIYIGIIIYNKIIASEQLTHINSSVPRTYGIYAFHIIILSLLYNEATPPTTARKGHIFFTVH